MFLVVRLFCCKDNADNCRKSLEIDKFIEIETIKFTTFLYDKRDKFSFPIVKYPSLNNNIHRRTVYNMIMYSQRK